MAAKTFRDIRAWQTAIDAALAVREASLNFSADERSSLTDPLRLSATAVAATISDAWRHRTRPSEFVAKLSAAEGFAAQTQTWIEFAARINALDKAAAATLSQKFDDVITQLNNMVEQPEKWATSKETLYAPVAQIQETLRKKTGISGRQPKQS
jgi:four helix bundle protein